jgi:hypothetical protein
MTLNDYLYRTRRILHDSQANTWTDPDLFIYINLARDRVAIDTNCCRSLPVIALPTNQEVYTFKNDVFPVLLTTTPAGVVPRAIIAILNINFIVSGTTKYALSRKAWSQLNFEDRQGPLQAGQSHCYAMFDLTSFYLSPVPPSPYTAEVDCYWIPANLVNYTDTETAIPDPLTELVPLMAARWAEYYENSYNEVEEFRQAYEAEKAQMLASMPPFSVENRGG